MGAMMVARRRSSVALHTYVLAVSAAGLGALALLATGTDLTIVPDRPVVFWVLVVCLVLSESFRLLLFGQDTQATTTAEAFAFAILLGWGTAPAAVALVIGSVAADLLHRVAPVKALFNAAQYALLIAIAGGVYEVLGGDRPFTAWDLPPLAATAAAYFVANLVLVGVVTTLAHGRDFLADLKECLRIEAGPYAVMFGLAPIVLLVAESNASLVPLLLLPLFAVYFALKSAVKAEEQRADAERAAKAARALAAEKVQLAEAERSLVERLRASDRFKDELLATVSHQLRTPLAGVLGALTTLSARQGSLSDEQRRELVAIAGRQGERLRELIEQLLLASRFEHAAGERVEQPTVDAAFLAGQAAAAAKVAHPERTILLEAGPTLPVRTAPEALLQVLVNLLDNAAKYSPDGTPIRLEAGRSGPVAVLAVEDAGPGVPASERDRIFERFTRLDSGTSRRVGGVGLGLYIARQLAQAQGGELLVGEPHGAGYGARFELRLPLAEQMGPVSLAPDGTIVEHPA
jgi:signal transduction histidine kinase